MSVPSALPTRIAFVRRLVAHVLLSATLVTFSLGIGALGYHELAGLGWLDATLNASMILTGMGPVDPLTTAPAKLFGIAYSLFSGVAFLSFAAVLIAPFAHRFLHRFHLERFEGESENSVSAR